MRFTWQGEIETVIDGDTVTVQTLEGRKTIRIDHIDAPEVGEPYFKESRNWIYQNFWGKTIEIWSFKTDKYNRLVGTIATLDGEYLHLEILREGLAFHYRKYSNDELAHAAEAEAKFKMINLWNDSKFHQWWLQRVLHGKRFYYKESQYYEIDGHALKIILDKGVNEERMTDEELLVFEEVIGRKRFKKGIKIVR